jgi:FAD synthase
MVFCFFFHFFDIQIMAKFNQKNNKISSTSARKNQKKKNSKNFSISLSKNIEILPGKKKHSSESSIN